MISAKPTVSRAGAVRSRCDPGRARRFLRSGRQRGRRGALSRWPLSAPHESGTGGRESSCATRIRNVIELHQRADVALERISVKTHHVLAIALAVPCRTAGADQNLRVTGRHKEQRRTRQKALQAEPWWMCDTKPEGMAAAEPAAGTIRDGSRRRCD